MSGEQLKLANLFKEWRELMGRNQMVMFPSENFFAALAARLPTADELVLCDWTTERTGGSEGRTGLKGVVVLLSVGRIWRVDLDGVPSMSGGDGHGAGYMTVESQSLAGSSIKWREYAALDADDLDVGAIKLSGVNLDVDLPLAATPYGAGRYMDAILKALQ